MFLLWIAYLLLTPTAVLTQSAPEELRKIARNPFADEIELPFEEDFTFNQGPFNRNANSLAIDPRIPLSITGDWLLVTRIVATAPAYQPNSLARTGGTTGIGDTIASFFFEPCPCGKTYLGRGAGSFNADGYKQSVGRRKMGSGSNGCGADGARMGLCRRAGSEYLVSCR